jgi:hypothetical protein
LYDIQVESRDSLHATLIEDPCTYDASIHKDERWTRAVPLEKLISTWEAEGKSGASVAFRSDLSYAAWYGDGPGAAQTVTGGMVWNQATQQLELKDGRESPCGPSKVGTYKLAFGADGKATFECVEDICAERRQMMTEWGPFQRSNVYAQPAGRYVGVEQPNYELLLTACGTQRMRIMPDEGEGLLREGTFSIDGNQLQFVDLRGDARCPEELGAYAYTLEGDTLKLEAVADACQARKDIVAACSTWTRIGNQ